MKRYILFILILFVLFESSALPRIIRQRKFLSTIQKMHLYRISKMIYDEIPVSSIIEKWIEHLGEEKNINLHKAASYIFRRFGDYMVRDIRFIKKRIARLKKFRINLSRQIERKKELSFLKSVALHLEKQRDSIDKDIKHEERKLSAIFFRNERKMKHLDLFLKKFRISSRPIWRFMREGYPGHYKQLHGR